MSFTDNGVLLSALPMVIGLGTPGAAFSHPEPALAIGSQTRNIGAAGGSFLDLRGH
jgi:hypothetical protein